MQDQKINRTPEITVHLLQDDGTFPNNAHLPLIVLSGVVLFGDNKSGDPGFLEKTFAANKWDGSWRNGIYPFHHYHSTAHEVLGAYAGSARVQFGGDTGPVVQTTAGDVVIIPAGVAHKNVWSSHDFRVVGAYPQGQSWDMNYGRESERPAADKRIAEVPPPSADPVYGKNGTVMERWGISGSRTSS